MILRLPFSSFPDRLRGVALLWLRMAAALTLARIAAAALTRNQQWSFIAIGLVAVCVAVGFLTPVAALPTALEQVTSMALHRAEGGWSAFLVASILFALTVLGPGAYSIDRWLFGRKRLTIGHSPH